MDVGCVHHSDPVSVPSSTGSHVTVDEITVVVVTYNAAAFIDDCLTALRSQTMPSHKYRVVVVDNASTDDTADVVAALHPWALLVRSDVNGGFGPGCELGLRAAPAPVVVLVNSDAVVTADFLEQIVKPLNHGPFVGAVTGHVLLHPRFCADPLGEVRTTDGYRWRPLLRDEESSSAVDIVNSTGNEVTADGFGYDRHYLTVDDGVAARADRDVFGFCGAAAALRTEAMQQVGGFDRRYFLYYEDTDLSWRLRLAGWSVEYARDAVARHRHQGSVGRTSGLHAYYDERNRLITVAKNASLPLAVTAWLRFPLTTLSLAIRSGEGWTVVRRRTRIYFSALRLLPGTIRRRRSARRDRCNRVRVDGMVRARPTSARLHEN